MNSEVTRTNQDTNADLVVIGGGGSGLAAAVTAAEKGAGSIFVLEKRGATGGTSAMASGIFASESPAQRRQAIIANTDDLFKRVMNWSHFSVDPRIIRAFMNKSGETIRWFEDMGLYFYCVPHSPIDNPLTWHVPKGEGPEIMQSLAEACRKLGVEIKLEAPAKEILLGPEGRVTGVVARQKDKEFTIKTRAVIIATGGFGGNKEMLQKYCPKYRENMRLSGLPNQGDGILMAMKAGALTDGLGMLMSAGPFGGGGGLLKLGTEPNIVMTPATFIVGEPVVIWINTKGRRFIDETASFNYYEGINAVIRQPESICYALFDSGMVRMVSDRGFGNVPSSKGFGEPQRSKLPPGLEEGIKEYAKKGTLKMSNSWDEIAEWIKTEREVLRNTIEEYNTACDMRYDPVFGKDRAYLIPLRNPPYYAVKCGSAMLNTMGGIKINERMEVLNPMDDPIPGLYAAGVDTGGWTPDTYCAMLPGTAFGYAINSGRIAGESAYEYTSR
jgi:fumarate reductase flavoprotein subunit